MIAVPELVVHRADRSAEPILRNLLPLYVHDMSEWFDVEPDAQGRFDYPGEAPWGDDGVYLARQRGIPVAFALVAPAPLAVGPAACWDMREFFVLRGHRRSGIGMRLATAIWNDRPGPWLVRALDANAPAVPFWRRAIAAHTRGAFREERRAVGGRPWTYFTFAPPG